MVTLSSILQNAELFLSLILAAGYVFAQNSRFDIKAHGTGYRFATGMNLTSEGIGVTTTDDISYTVDITLGGQNFTVLLDTGSTDLWVNTTGRTLQLSNRTSLITSIGYAQGEVEGFIDFAELKIGDFTVESQAFISAASVANFKAGMDGILGMAFDVGSIYTTVQHAWGTVAADALGRAPITALFAKEPSLPNNFDVQLARTSETEDSAEGAFTISRHAPGYEAIETAPKLPRVSAEHWSIVMDSMNINGEPFAFNKSRIAGTPSGKIVAALDTGFSFPPLPPAAVDAIYSTVPGAMLDPITKIWFVPCSAGTNLSFVFGGQSFYVHPLDLTWPWVQVITIDGVPKNYTTCVNTYQPLTLDPSTFVGFDIILGDAFLRNVYASFDYGDYYPANHTNGLPFVQMLSTTDASKMWDEFSTERAATLAELPPELSPAEAVKLNAEIKGHSAAETNVGTTGAVTTASSGEDSWTKQYGTIVLGLLAANLAVGATLLAFTIAICVRGRRSRNMRSYVPVQFKETAEDFGQGC